MPQGVVKMTPGGTGDTCFCRSPVGGLARAHHGSRQREPRHASTAAGRVDTPGVTFVNTGGIERKLAHQPVGLRQNVAIGLTGLPDVF